jgi:Phage integrase central domain
VRKSSAYRSGASKAWLRREHGRKTAAHPENTFEKIAENYLARDGKELRTVEQRRAMLKRLVYPKLGSRQIMDIRDIVSLLDKIEDENGPVMADRTFATIRKVMNWHASRSDEFRSARTSGKDRARARILTDDELRAIWKAAKATGGPLQRTKVGAISALAGQGAIGGDYG